MIFSKDITAAPNAQFAAALSIIVPVTYGEIRWRGLFQDLEALPLTVELVVVGPQCPERAQEWLDAQRRAGRPTLFIKSAKGRAKQLNNAVRMTSRPFLWFLHADTRLPHDALSRLATAAQVDANGLWFFDLEFLNDGPVLTKINAIAASWRSNVCKLPFGDQGFFMSRYTYDKLGGFSETVRYGEDHMLVWQAHHLKIPVRNVGTKIQTSAAKYAEQGWLTTTVKHQFLTWKQALPEALAGWWR